MSIDANIRAVVIVRAMDAHNQHENIQTPLADEGRPCKSCDNTVCHTKGLVKTMCSSYMMAHRMIEWVLRRAEERASVRACGQLANACLSRVFNGCSSCDLSQRRISFSLWVVLIRHVIGGKPNVIKTVLSTRGNDGVTTFIIVAGVLNKGVTHASMQ